MSEPTVVNGDRGRITGVARHGKLRRTNPAVGYLMPDFHNPTGRSMSAGLRERTLELADQHGTTLIADETMAELYIDGNERMLPFAAYGRVDT